MPWDWDKLQKQKMGRSGGSGGNPSPQMDEVINKFKGLKGKLPGFWIIIALVVILIALVREEVKKGNV